MVHVHSPHDLTLKLSLIITRHEYLNVVLGMAPISLRVHITQFNKLLMTRHDASYGSRDLARDKRLACSATRNTKRSHSYVLNAKCK